MVKHMEGVVVELLQHKDLHKFQSFIREHWKKDHVLVTGKELIDWQHLDKENNQKFVELILDEKKKNKTIIFASHASLISSGCNVKSISILLRS